MRHKHSCCFEIRSPRVPFDIDGIVNVVRNCPPYLTTTYPPYFFWMVSHIWPASCAVAALDGEIVGWCSILPQSRGKYFLHHIGVAPTARQHGVAEELLMHLRNGLKHQPGFALEFTVDQRNTAARNLLRRVADHAGLDMQRSSDVLAFLEPECREELYVMSPHSAIQAAKSALILPGQKPKMREQFWEQSA